MKSAESNMDIADSLVASRQRPLIAVMLASAAVLIFGLIIMSALSKLGPQTMQYSLITMDTRSLKNKAVPLSSSMVDGHWRHSAKLVLSANVLPDSISLIAATEGKAYPIKATKIVASNCDWSAPDLKILRDNQTVTWHRQVCAHDTARGLELSFETEQPSQIYLWGVAVPVSVKASEPKIITLDIPVADQKTEQTLLYGAVGNDVPYPNLHIVDLLAAMWGSPIAPSTIWILLAGALVLLLTGTLLRVASYRWAAHFWAFFIWMGLSTFYAILTPPFQAPDEPDHLLSFLKLTNQTELAQSALDLANKGHFERIKFHPEQKFTGAHIGAPLTGGWAPHIDGPDAKVRAPLAAATWSFLAPMIPNSSLATLLLSLRLAQATFVGLCLLIGSLALGSSAASFSTLVLVIPALPMFGMHVSNYFTTVGLALVTGLFLFMYLADLRRLMRALPVLYLSVGLLPFSSAVATGAFILWILVLPVLTLEIRAEFLAQRLSKRLWLTVLTMAFSAVGTTFFANPNLSDLSAILTLWRSETGLVQKALLLNYGLPLLPLLLWLPIWERFWNRSAIQVSKLVRFFVATVSVAWAAIWFFVNLKPLNTLPDIETVGTIPAALHYVTKELFIICADLLPSRLEFYVSKTFWGGFGWLESMPPDLLLNLACMPLGVGLIVVLGQLYKRPEFDRFARTFLIAGLTIGMFAGLALDRYTTRINLHGRYLLFFYLYLASIAASAWQHLFDHLRVNSSGFSARENKLFVLVYLLTIHGWALVFLINRYFVT